MKTTVVLADDHKVIRQGLRTLIEEQSDMEVVGEAGDGRAAIDMCEDLQPDVVVMDVAMPDLNGIEATRHVVSECPDTKVLALSMHADRHYAAGMLGAGATGYVLKDCAFDELADAIRTVADGGRYLSAEIEGVVLKDYVERLSGGGGDSAFSVLTDREREVLQLVAEGQTTKEIAANLHVSVKTVESHRQNIMDKLELRSIAELTKYAIREGLTSLDT